MVSQAVGFRNEIEINKYSLGNALSGPTELFGGGFRPAARRFLLTAIQRSTGSMVNS